MQVCELLHTLFNVRQRITSAYHPQSNGLDERTNQTIKKCLEKLTGDNEDNWDDLLDPVLFSIRTSVQESTKFTPFYLMHGREARLPLEAESRTVTSSDHLIDVQQTVIHLKKVKEAVFPKVKVNIESSQKRQKEQYRRRKGVLKTPIHVGDTVLRLNMLKRTKKGHKMEDTWRGPYKVTDMTKCGSCVLHCIKTNTTMKRKVNVRQLKLYREQQKIEPVEVEELDTSTVQCIEQEGQNVCELESQLFDHSLFRLWRTGSTMNPWRAEEDDDSELIDQVVSGNEYWLSINADVALWLDWRTFNKMPLLSAVSDFVLVSSEIHHEFDEFVKMEGSTGTTLLPAVDLIHFWASTKGQSLSLVHRYGKQYVQISSLQLDDICLWVRGMREQYARCGKSVFEAASSSVHKVTSLSTSSLKWLQDLDLEGNDRLIIEGKASGGWLSDKHMHAAQLLLRKQFPHISGLQSTLLCQSYGFSAVSSDAVQIHFTGSQHWVTSTCFGGNVQLYDSNVGFLLTTSLEIQLAQLYGAARKNNQLLIKQMPVQQQSNGRDCGLFAIAYAFHAALGNDLTELNFNCSQMRQHVTNCFEQGMLSPFPVSRIQTSRRCAARQYQISLFCSCLLPKSYSRSMVECYVCETLYHDTCVTTSPNQEHFICNECCLH
jgi:hypothetical protein